MNAYKIRCSAFEWQMLAQDCRTFPCVIIYSLAFRGQVQRQLLEQALQQTLARHPLLRAKVDRERHPLHWLILPETQVAVRWSDQPATDIWAEDCTVDIGNETGLQLTVQDFLDPASQSPCCNLVFLAHHACVDGIGLKAVVHELMEIYDALVRGCVPNLQPLNPDALAVRNGFGLNAWKILRLIPEQMVGLLGVRQFFMRQPVAIVPHQAPPNDGCATQSVTVVEHQFDPKQTRKLGEMAVAQHVSLNELLASSIFQGISDFQAALGFQQDSAWLRMMVPVSMRSVTRDQGQTACNIVSSIFLDRTAKQIRDAGNLLRSIHLEMDLIKKNQLALMFSFSLWLRSRLVSRRLPRLPGKCQVSVVFTNLGKIYARSTLAGPEKKMVTGGLQLEHVGLVAPLAPYTCLACSAQFYADSLRLVMRFDARVLDKVAVTKLMNMITDRLAPGPHIASFDDNVAPLGQEEAA